MFLDYKKAFVSVDHNIFIKKQEYCGVIGVELKFLNRILSVDIKELKSTKLLMSCQ